MTDALPERVIIVGVGSRIRGDDAVGPLVIDHLKERMDDEGCPEGDPLSLIDADVMPENFTKPIRESGAGLCIIIDAVDIRLEPGVLRKVPLELIDETIPCSHSIPISYLMQYIGEKVPRVELIGIQIGTTGLFQEMTGMVIKAGEALSDIIWRRDWDSIDTYVKGETLSEKEATNYCW